MNAKFTLTVCLLSLAFAGRAQNQIITPVGKPLVIGHQGGVKFSHLNAATPTQASNGRVLSVDDNGVIMLVPESTGTASQWTSTGTNPDLYFNSGNVGIGTDTPLQRLDVNGSINLPAGSGIRLNNVSFIGAPGTNNMLLGVNSGGGLGSGESNVFIGSNSGTATTTGSYNTFIGSNTGYSNVSGRNNIMVGNLSGYSLTAGVENTFLGEKTGYNTTIGSKNIFIGKDAGLGNVDGYQNVLIGHEAKTTGTNAASLNNAVAIGYRAYVSASNSLVLGGTGFFGVNVGIGVTAPQTRLHVVTDGTLATGIRFENLPNTNGTGAYRLYADSSGNVLRLATPGARESSQDGHWSLTAGGHLLNGNAGGVVIGTGLSGTPPGYRLYVSDGILAERVKVAVKSTADWRDNVLGDAYRLRPLEEVDSYIRQKGHLPGVPTAKDMVANGNDLHQTDALLLEKVEELTLYVIALKKEAKADRDEYEKKLRWLTKRMEELEKK